MSENDLFEQIRNGQSRDEEALKKHMGSYRTKDVDQYIEKVQNRLRNTEKVFQERYEEMRTNLLGMTRERDELASRADTLEEKLKDMPQYCQTYLKEQGMVILPVEEYETIRNIDVKEYETLKKADFKQKSLEQKNSQLADELEKAQAAQTEAKETASMLEQMGIQAKTQVREIEELSLQLETQAKQLAQTKEELEKSEVLRQNQALELAQAHSRYQMLELQYKLALEKNQQLARGKESQEKETARTKELWDTDRSYLMQRFGGVLLSQQQAMQNMQETMAAAMQYMEKLGVDFLNQSAAEAAKEK